MESSHSATGPLFDRAAYNEHSFPALRLTRSSRMVRRVAKGVLVVIVVAVNAFIFIPWQQTVFGRGMVVTFDPRQRPQEVQAPIKGLIVNWHDNIREGAQVKQGDVLVEIRAVEESVRQLQNQLEATQRKRSQQEKIVLAYESKFQAKRESRTQIIAYARREIEIAKQDLAGTSAYLPAAKAELELTELDLRREENLNKTGASSDAVLQKAQASFRKAQSELEQANIKVLAAKERVSAKESELLYKIQDADAEINTATAEYDKAKGDVAEIDKDIADIRNKQAVQVQVVTAPLDGFILNMKVFAGGQNVKEGDPLLDIVPDTVDRAVALKIEGNDAPLVSSRPAVGEHRKVRLQFEGWPAVQFAGWPSAARGTFGGIVTVVDSTDDGLGKFRVLIKPDPDDHPWPPASVLRQGVRANGWVMLDVVPLGQELWRQFNGFPPVVANSDGQAKEEKLLRGKK